MASKPRQTRPCEESTWGRAGLGPPRPCGKPGRYEAREQSGRLTYLCGIHANSPRWSFYPDISWRALW